MVKRWWEQYCKLPWPDSIAFFLRGLVVEGEEETTRMVRRTVIRYCLLAYILCIRKFSDRLHRQFPDMRNLVRTGILRMDEAKASLQNLFIQFKRDFETFPFHKRST